MRDFLLCTALIVVVAIMAFLFVGPIDQKDPFGATTRIQIQETGATQRTALEADAAKYAATQGTMQAGIWAGTMPIVVALLMAGSVILLIVWYRGKAHLMMIQQQPSPYPPVAPYGVTLLAMHLAARERLINGQWALMRNGQQIGWAMPVDGQWALVDNDRQVLALLERKS